MTAIGVALARARAKLASARGDERGMTLLETMLAMSLSVMLVLPMLGWAQMALKQQVATRERNISGASLGLLRSYFIKDVATAHRAFIDGDEFVDCSGGSGAKGELLLVLVRSDRQVVYTTAPGSESGDSLWRRSCDLRERVTDQATELVESVLPAATSVDCRGTEAPQEVLQQAESLQRANRLQQSDADKAAADDAAGNSAGRDDSASAEPSQRWSTGKRVNGSSPRSETIAACRRVNLRVTTTDLTQTSLSAVVRSDPTLADSDYADELAPIVALTAEPTKGAAPLEVRFSAKGSSDPRGGELRLRWDFGDGSESAERDPVHTYATPGEYQVTLTATNEIGDSTSKSVTISALNQDPVAVIASPVNGTKVARGELVAFSSAGSNDDLDKARTGQIASYAWDFGDGTTSTEANPRVAFQRLSSAEGFTVTLTVTDNDGGVARTSVQVLVVNRAPTVSILASTTSGKAPLTVDFSSVVVDETTMNPNPALTYAWTFGDGTTSTLADPPALTYTSAGTKSVTLTVTDDAGATATATQLITVTEASAVGAPKDLRVASSGVEQGKRYMEFAWTRVEGADYYEVALRSVYGSETASGFESGTTVRIRGLNAGRTDYYAKVRARDTSGNWGPWSTEIQVRS